MGYHTCMTRTTVYLPDHIKTRLTAAAARRGRSEADLIREGVERVLDDEPAPPKPRLGVCTLHDPTLPTRVDEALAEGFGR